MCFSTISTHWGYSQHSLHCTHKKPRSLLRISSPLFFCPFRLLLCRNTQRHSHNDPPFSTVPIVTKNDTLLPLLQPQYPKKRTVCVLRYCYYCCLSSIIVCLIKKIKETPASPQNSRENIYTKPGRESHTTLNTKTRRQNKYDGGGSCVSRYYLQLAAAAIQLPLVVS